MSQERKKRILGQKKLSLETRHTPLPRNLSKEDIDLRSPKFYLDMPLSLYPLQVLPRELRRKPHIWLKKKIRII
jgi:hypothetical protein